MKSGGAVLWISLLQLVVGLCLLGIFEKYKVNYFNPTTISTEDDNTAESEDKPDDRIHTPLDWLLYISIFNNIFSVFGLAGVLHAIKELVMAFFAFNAVQMVVAFHFFIDIWTDMRIRSWSAGSLGGYEKAATAFMFFNFILSICATISAMKALEEIKTKQREEYNRLSVISDTLQYEADENKL